VITIVATSSGGRRLPDRTYEEGRSGSAAKTYRFTFEMLFLIDAFISVYLRYHGFHAKDLNQRMGFGGLFTLAHLGFSRLFQVAHSPRLC